MSAVSRGVICLLKVVDGIVKKGDRVIASATDEVYDVLEVCAHWLAKLGCTYYANVAIPAGMH